MNCRSGGDEGVATQILKKQYVQKYREQNYALADVFLVLFLGFFLKR
jgi:hypothetical protein